MKKNQTKKQRQAAERREYLIENLERYYIITEHRTEEEREGKGKRWKKVSEEIQEITPEYYANRTDPDATRLMKMMGGTEKQTESYTAAGLMITEITITSPDQTRRITVKYEITHRLDALRERYKKAHQNEQEYNQKRIEANRNQDIKAANEYQGQRKHFAILKELARKQFKEITGRDLKDIIEHL